MSSELPEGSGKCVHECSSDGSGGSPRSLAGHAQTDAQADASHLFQGKDWRSLKKTKKTPKTRGK